ncbi:hypothetical protein SAMD00024442_72_5 [Candidatus Symbiothrix dinenymphae]|nr:hypothetical protein SAMD00024442_72_5 [Candidatus Symbiothrix dinenymphae]
MKNLGKMAILLLFVVAGFYSCEERDRFAISSDDSVPPAPPVLDTVWRLPGGGRIFYKIPADRDLLSIEASFTATNGKLTKSAASFVAPYLEVFGLPDSLEHTIQLYAVDVAGNKSASVPVTFSPLEPAYSKVAKALTVKPAFDALLVNWENELMQDITVYVDFTYSDSDNGTERSLTQVYSSRKPAEQHFIKDLHSQAPVSVKVRVEDLYGNRSETIDKGQMQLLTDVELDKSKFVIPDAGVRIGGELMGYGSSFGANIAALCDGYIDYLAAPNGNGRPDNFAFFHSDVAYLVAGVNVNMYPWNIFIDLGDYYELSRIVTHQMWDLDPTTAKPTDLGGFYSTTNSNNIGAYNMYYWDGDEDAVNGTGTWVSIDSVKLPMPSSDMGVLDKIRQAVAGDEALMYPNNPTYTPRTRYFRYQVQSSFAGNYANGGRGMSELTLYGKKK